MNIGIITKDENEIFSNGCNQQSIFVYKTLSQIESVKFSLLTIESKEKTFINIPTINIENITQLYIFDILICVSNKIKQNELLNTLKNKDIKIVEYNCGNLYYIYQEDIIFNTHNYIDNEINNIINVWNIPNYTKDNDFYKSILKTTNINTAPYVWDETIIKYYNKDLEYSYHNSEIKYLLILEPNMQITKTCLIPLLICEELYKTYNKIKILCICKKDNNGFTKFISSLNIYKDNKIELYSRMAFFNIIQQLKEQKKDIFIISHQIDNPLNFLHLESFYLNYPLIHNSEYYKNAGYYYSNISSGNEKLLYAINNHNINIEDYKNETKKVLECFSPNNKINQDIYYKLLLDLK